MMLEFSHTHTIYAVAPSNWSSNCVTDDIIESKSNFCSANPFETIPNFGDGLDEANKHTNNYNDKQPVVNRLWELGIVRAP